MEYLQINSSEHLLRGMRHSMQRPREASLPVILVHGYFSANRNGPQRLFIEIAERLAQLGLIVYRFDLSGMGESDGDIKKIGFHQHKEDLDSIIRFVHHKHSNQKIKIIAHSMGCNLALSLVQKNIDLFDNIILLAPFLTNEITLKNIISADKIQQMEKEAFTYRKGLYVDSSYFLESQTNKFINTLHAISLKINIIVAENDQFIPKKISLNALRNTNANIICLPNADHNFLEVHDILLNLISEIFIPN